MACSSRFFNKGNTKGIGGNRFDTLFEDRYGALWASTEDSWLVKYHAGVFNTYTAKEGLPSWVIRQIEEDEAGTFQIVSREGIAKWKDGRFIIYSLKEPDTYVRWREVDLWKQAGVACRGQSLFVHAWPFERLLYSVRPTESQHHFSR